MAGRGPDAMAWRPRRRPSVHRGNVGRLSPCQRDPTAAGRCRTREQHDRVDVDRSTRANRSPLGNSWGWIATPVRPLTPQYRGWLTGNCDLSPGFQWYSPPGSDFDPRWLNYSQFIGHEDRPDGKGKCMVSRGPYVVTEACPTDVPEFAYWGDEWSPSRLGRKVDNKVGACSVAARSWTDYSSGATVACTIAGVTWGCTMITPCACPTTTRNHGPGAGRVAASAHATIARRPTPPSANVLHVARTGAGADDDSLSPVRRR